MIFIREVCLSKYNGKWAYIEYSDEGPHLSILGGKEFETKEEALEWQVEFDNRERVENLNKNFSWILHQLQRRRDEINEMKGQNKLRQKAYEKLCEAVNYLEEDYINERDGKQ